MQTEYYTPTLNTKLNDIIKIKFLENPPYNLDRTLTSRILNSKDENGNIITTEKHRPCACKPRQLIKKE